MSVDQLGRVIVASGHFASRAPEMVNAATRVAVGGGHLADRAGNVFEKAQNVVRICQDAHQASKRMSHRLERIADDASRAQAREDLLNSLAQTQDFLLDVLQAGGSAASGDLQGAYEKSIDAGLKAAGVVWQLLTDQPPNPRR